MESPKVFISYAWEDQELKDWVLKLANKLRNDSVDVILDRYESFIGQDLQKLIKNAIHESDKIIIVLTPNYKANAENARRGVGYEYSLINAELENQKTNKVKFLPLLRKGNIIESVPNLLQKYAYADFTNKDSLEENYGMLLHAIYDSNEKDDSKDKKQWDAIFHNASLSDLSIEIEPGSAPDNIVAELLAELSILYRATGGSGINFELSNINIYNTHTA